MFYAAIQYDQDFPEFASVYTLSCLRLDALELVQEKAETLFSQVNNGLQLGHIPSASRVREITTQPGRFSIATRYNQIELMDWCKQYSGLFPEETMALQPCLQRKSDCAAV